MNSQLFPTLPHSSQLFPTPTHPTTVSRPPYPPRSIPARPFSAPSGVGDADVALVAAAQLQLLATTWALGVLP